MQKQKIFKKILAVTLIVTILFGYGCRKKESNKDKRETQKITLQVWNVFDDAEVYEPLFAEFKSRYIGLQIEYRKFNDPIEYLDLLLNEMAEGEGPDVFFIHNSWIPKHYKKIIPADISFLPAAGFKETFVSVAADDCVLREIQGDGEQAQVIERVYCMPIYIDNLALYYNKEHFEEALPETGKPAETWEQIKDQVFKLTKQDNSFEKFARCGIALGRSDNIARAYDILQLLILQSKANIYTEDGSKAIFASQQGVSPTGQAYFPGREILELYTGFSNPNNKEYNWNKFISNPKSLEKEITPFVKGKVSMVLGYSYLYDTIADQIELESKKGAKVISTKDIAVAQIPQIFDPQAGESKITLASYFAPTVARTSQNAKIAWELISFMNTKENQKYYNETTKRPTSRRDLLDEQTGDPIYGTFVKQIGFSKSFKVADNQKYEEIFLDAIDSVVENRKRSIDAIKDAEDAINQILETRRVF